MADRQQHDTRTTRRPDCVTEIRMGNSVLVVSGYFKKDTTTTAADKWRGYWKRKPLLHKNRQLTNHREMILQFCDTAPAIRGTIKTSE